MLAKRLIKSNDAGGGACTNTVDLYNPLPDGGGVALYQLNGDATDVSGNYNGTWNGTEAYVTGVFGQAASFNGSSQITMNNTVQTSLTFTASLWVNGVDMNRNSSDPNQIQTIFYNRNPYLVISQYNGNWQYTIKNSSSQNTTINYATSNFNDNQWYNFVISCEGLGGQMSFYIDGQLVGTNMAPTSTINVASTGYIGSGGGQQYFNGSIDQVRFFNRALRPYEVEALYTEEYCTPTIVPSEHFNTVTYTGNGSSQSISVGFQPDLVWIKNRAAANPHSLQDTVTGDFYLRSNATDAAAPTNGFNVSSFNSDGITVKDDTNGAYNVNGSVGGLYSGDAEYVAWNFKAGGAAVTNTDGTITSQVSANTEAGFSVVTATMGSNFPQTIGHGLGTAPDVIIAKRRSISSNWVVYHKDVDANPQNYTLFLESTDAKLSTAFPWNNNAPTSSVFTTGEFFSNNETMVAYCFAEVEGFSNFGSYVGTGASGNTIVTGFEPAFVMIKETTNPGSWHIYDNKRANSGLTNRAYLLADSSEIENFAGSFSIDFLTNGFQIKNTGNGTNRLNGNYIYMAFAADPTTIEPSLEDSFNTVTYSGTSGTQSITGVGFQPDLVWAKNRTAAPTAHILSDSVRGIKQLTSSGTDAEGSSTNMITSYDSDGFGVGDAFALCNASGYNFVAWCWKGAELPAINSNGSIPSVVSANPAAGFSIVSYTGNGVESNVGHGLNETPAFIIIKNRTNDAENSWAVWNKNQSSQSQFLVLNSNDSYLTNSGVFGSTPHSSSVFNVGNLRSRSGINYIAYCFAEVAGFSKFGSYTGNGGNQTITTDFEPKFVIIKCSSAGESYRNWFMLYKDGSSMKAVIANGAAAEFDQTGTITFNSDNFNINCGGCGEYNQSGQTYIYMAFANQF
jgi:hypothetical protein